VPWGDGIEPGARRPLDPDAGMLRGREDLR